MKVPSLKGNPILRAHTRGTLYALILTLGGVLLFALLVKIMGGSSSTIKPIVQIIKVVSIFIGVYTILRTVENRAWLHGGTLGIIYTVLAFFVLSIIDSNFSVTGGFFVEAMFAFAIGVASAMLLRLRKREA